MIRSENFDPVVYYPSLTSKLYFNLYKNSKNPKNAAKRTDKKAACSEHFFTHKFFGVSIFLGLIRKSECGAAQPCPRM